MKELGIFCGTFNPIHWGHLLVAECARDQFRLQKVLFVTCATPPHRRLDLLDGESRHALVEAAISDNPRFEACRIELDRPGPSYTIDTVRYVFKQHGSQTHLNLIIGADNLRYVSGWHEAHVLLSMCRLLVAPRLAPVSDHEHADIPASDDYLAMASLAEISFPSINVSSSEIRQRLRKRQSVLYMVPPAVNDLLIANKYYQDAAQPRSGDKQ